MNRQYNIAIGLLRPPHVFFFDLDSHGYRKLKKLALKHLKYFSLYRTKHGYHVIGYPFSRRVWRIFKRNFKTDYHAKLHKRFRNGFFSEQILRINSKFDDDLGQIVSSKPKKIYGNFELINCIEFVRFYKCK